ncbi:hypothetical protein QBC34DRAFT_471700 [Podospora aff. communis PSN243]|uniref:Beta/gamma crystallin 'Greek key' domain-containing protein n=1 Tax=Podospora aff. communis PSN243 TaxID=3040156 RepID=A0AAV9GAG1_9PEZI|nr:hypothetical protein QBC34DRAFT_471700 [Podospora aff. communis PSN243]
MAPAFHSFVSILAAISALTPTVAGVWVKYCEHSGFGGRCVEISPKVNECHNVPSNMNDKLSSYQVVHGHCDFFKDSGCNGFLWQAKNREHDNVSDPRHKDQVSSIRCTHSCCPSTKAIACQFACNSNCGRGPIPDLACQNNCRKTCCPEGVMCSD